MAVKKKTFEQCMLRLEEIVNRLEAGDTSLEESMALFEEGTRLSAECAKQLDSAEQKVWKLTKGSDGAPVQELMEG